MWPSPKPRCNLAASFTGDSENNGRMRPTETDLNQPPLCDQTLSGILLTWLQILVDSLSKLVQKDRLLKVRENSATQMVTQDVSFALPFSRMSSPKLSLCFSYFCNFPFRQQSNQQWRENQAFDFEQARLWREPFSKTQMKEFTGSPSGS